MTGESGKKERGKKPNDHDTNKRWLRKRNEPSKNQENGIKHKRTVNGRALAAVLFVIERDKVRGNKRLDASRRLIAGGLIGRARVDIRTISYGNL